MTPGDPDAYRVETPEQIDLAYDTAGLGSRFLSTLVDAIVQVVLLALTFGLGALGLRWLFDTFLPGDQRNTSAALGFALVVGFAIWWGYHVFFEVVWHGQTPGKRAIGLRVIKEGGYPIGLGEALIRNVLRIVDMLPAFYGIGGLVMFFDKRSRRLGDMAAGTLVVKERRELAIAVAPSIRDAAVAAGGAPIANLARLTSADLGLLRDYLARRAQLSPRAAEALTDRLAESLASRLGCSLAGEPADQFLTRLAAQLGIGAPGSFAGATTIRGGWRWVWIPVGCVGVVVLLFVGMIALARVAGSGALPLSAGTAATVTAIARTPVSARPVPTPARR